MSEQKSSSGYWKQKKAQMKQQKQNPKPPAQQQQGPTPPSFNPFDPNAVKKAEDNQALIQQQLDMNKVRATNAPKPDFAKVHKIVAKGKALADKFFRFTETEERGNVQVQIDDRFVDRVIDQYHNPIEHHLIGEKLDDKAIGGTTLAPYLNAAMLGIGNIAVATKLYQAGDNTVKSQLQYLGELHQSTVRLPKKLHTLIDCVGITDLPGGDKIRIYNHTLLAKRQAVRGLLRSLGEVRVGQDLEDSTNYTLQKFKDRILKDEWIHGMIDSEYYSVDRLKSYTQWKFEEMTKETFSFRVGTTGPYKWKFRLPEFNFKEVNITSIQKYMNNPIFGEMVAEKPEKVLRIVCLLACQLVTKQWLKPGKSLQTLQTLHGFSIHDYVNSAKLIEIFDECKVWNVNDYLTDRNINSMIGESILKWNDGLVRYIEKPLDVSDFKYSKFGTEAQLVQFPSELNKDLISGNTNQYNLRTDRWVGKGTARSKFKLSPSDAMIGIPVGFSQMVDVSLGYKIEYNEDQNKILNEYIKSDIRH